MSGRTVVIMKAVVTGMRIVKEIRATYANLMKFQLLILKNVKLLQKNLVWITMAFGGMPKIIV